MPNPIKLFSITTVCPECGYKHTDRDTAYLVNDLIKAYHETKTKHPMAQRRIPVRQG
jgi:C4-type Zn-finger protein